MTKTNDTPAAKKAQGSAQTFDHEDNYEAGAARQPELRKDDGDYHPQRARFGERDRADKQSPDER